jgi:uncharacterized OsmC-like protein
VTLELHLDAKIFALGGQTIQRTSEHQQQFRVNIKINSDSATEEQINELHEIGKKFSPAFDTLTNGTSVIIINSQ